MGPACHPLCTIKSLFLDFFPSYFWSLAFFFRSHAASETLRSCWLMGPTCHPRYYKSFFSWIFFTLLFLAVSFFFWSPAALETLIKLLTQGARMSSSMYNQLARSWGGRACISGTHMSSSMYNKSLFFLDYFLHLVFGLFPFSFDLMPPLKSWVRCWLMGPACHPLCTIKFLFLDFFYPLIFGHLPFSFDHMQPLKLRSQVAHGSHMSASMNNKPFLCWIYFRPIISSYFPFYFDPLPPLKRWGPCWLMDPTCKHLWTIKVSFVGFIFDP